MFFKSPIIFNHEYEFPYLPQLTVNQSHWSKVFYFLKKKRKESNHNFSDKGTYCNFIERQNHDKDASAGKTVLLSALKLKLKLAENCLSFSQFLSDLFILHQIQHFLTNEYKISTFKFMTSKILYAFSSWLSALTEFNFSCIWKSEDILLNFIHVHMYMHWLE